MVLDAILLSTQHNKVMIKGQEEQSREWSIALPNTSVYSYWKGNHLVALDKGCQLYLLNLGTIFSKTFRMPKSSVIIFLTLSVFMFSWHSIIRIVNWRSPLTNYLTCWIVTSVLRVESDSHLESYFPSFRLFWAPCLNQKHVWATWCYFYAFADVFQVLVTEFSLARAKNWELLFANRLSFVLQCSEVNELIKRRYTQKHVEVWMVAEN